MNLTNNFQTTIDILHRTLDAQLIRQNVIANNIANSDTPNFKRTVVNFESALNRALQSETETHFTARRTNEKHISFREPAHYTDVRVNRVLDYATTAKNNGNNVDIEVETTNLLQSQLSYGLYATTIDQIFDRIRVVLG